jgi:prepilin-type N-terminal cleavage/methylation domain-containing protein
MTRRRSRRGFTLLEVMIGLGILGFSLTVLIKSASSSMMNAARAQMIGVVTDLSRGKMYDIEEKLLKDGFTDTDQSEDDKDFAEEGWPNIKYSYKVEQVELPSWDDLQSLAQGRGSGSGSGSGSAGDIGGGFQDSALGGMMAQLGGGFGGTGSADIDSKNGASFIQGQYSLIAEVLKVSIRKVTLTVMYKVTQSADEESLVTVAYFTDSAAMDKVLMGFGSQEIPDNAGSGSGSGSGSGRGSGSSGGSRPTRPTGGSGK